MKMLSSSLSLKPCSSPMFSFDSISSKIQFPFISNSKWPNINSPKLSFQRKAFNISCSENPNKTLKTCKICKTQFDPALNHPRACRFHTAHFGGETKRKFESVYTGGTMNTPDSGQVFQYWHCCGSEDPFDPGCTSSPHLSYDD